MIALIFLWVTEFLKLRYKTEEQLSGFYQIVFMEFFNMAFIVLITSFDPSNTVNILRGTPQAKVYQGFEPKWYTDVGDGICQTIFLSAVFTNIPEIQEYVKAEATRLMDRGFKPNLKKDLEDEIDDEPNSKLKLQDHLDELYLGPEWDGPGAISRMISTLLVICSYSSGMPILYVIGFVFFYLTYLVNKLVLFKFYQKTLTLDRLLPTQVTQLFNTAVYLHLFMGCFMLTNHILFMTKDKPTEEVFVMPTYPVDPKTEIQEFFGIGHDEHVRVVNAS